MTYSVIVKRLMHFFLLVAVGLCSSLAINLIIPTLSSAQQGQQDKQFQTLVEADKLYLLEKRAEAETLYRKVKPPFPQERSRSNAATKPITDPEQLSGAAKVYWRNAEEGMQQGLVSKVEIPLRLLLEQAPEFIPAYTLYAEAVKKFEWKDDVIAPLEKAVSLFPDSVDLTKALIKAHQDKEQWLEASITARQFAIVYSNDPAATELTQIADSSFDRFRRRLNGEILGQSIVGAAIGIFTGDGLNQVIRLAPLMLQGESGMGAHLAQAYKQKLSLVEDPAIVEYVTKIGDDIAALMGRKDFNYEYYVVRDEALNAFALPGGKVFINTGAILAANSEAELAGLIGHELAHAVLSHGFQRITKANLLANIGQALPLGNLLSTVVTSEFSRQDETQSDLVGTRAISVAGYAADGMRNLFVTLQQRQKQSQPTYLSTHPATSDRIRNLEALIQQNGYNRYAFEGVKRHAEIKERIKQL